VEVVGGLPSIARDVAAPADDRLGKAMPQSELIAVRGWPVETRAGRRIGALERLARERCRASVGRGGRRGTVGTTIRHTAVAVAGSSSEHRSSAHAGGARASAPRARAPLVGPG